MENVTLSLDFLKSSKQKIGNDLAASNRLVRNIETCDTKKAAVKNRQKTRQRPTKPGTLEIAAGVSSGLTEGKIIFSKGGIVGAEEDAQYQFRKLSSVPPGGYGFWQQKNLSIVVKRL